MLGQCRCHTPTYTCTLLARMLAGGYQLVGHTLLIHLPLKLLWIL